MTRRPSPIKHGTLYAYKRHRCRCDDCREANRNADREYRRRLGRPAPGNPVVIEGQEFKTQSAAARAHGVSTSAIHYHLTKHGHFGKLGGKPGGAGGGNRKSVRVGPYEWPSRADAARFLGISACTVSHWIVRGHADRLLAAAMQAEAKHRRAA